MLNPSPSPPERPSEQRPPQQDPNMLGAPPPSSMMASPVKKRRMTITGAPHALNTDVRVPPDQTNSTPISPVVMGFTIQRDNPKEVEQLKSMMNVKQKQKALIEQRRGSHGGPALGNTAPPPPASESGNKAPPPSSISIRNARRSPNGGAGTRRPIAPQQPNAPRPTSPNPSVFQMQQAQLAPHQSAHTLPPPPISFARRRAAQLGTKKKPADIVISPREQHSTEQFQPFIHSAPPTQGAFYTGRHTMALPRLPNVMNSGGGESTRRLAGNVPPTPTRFSQRVAASAIPPSITVSESTPRSPMASVPIASSLVPPTPAFNQSEFSGDKAAFLAPFGYFYDALNDAKQLKTWLGEQLQRSNSLYQSLAQQRDKLDETIDAIVEKKLSGMYNEITGLRRRVAELEEALHESRSGRHSSGDHPPVYHSKSLQNGYPSSSGLLAPDSYTFPPSDHSRFRSDQSSGQVPSPRGQESRGGSQQHQSEQVEYEGTSGSYDSRRPSVSASRLDPPRSHPHDSSSLPSLAPPSQSRISRLMQSPPPVYHDHDKSSRSEVSRPAPSRQPSYNGVQDRERERERERERDWDRERDRRGDSPRREDSRRNSVIMSTPDHRMED
ncbi:hypothetical protein CC2G_012757 [Coprinopsis cinerea AmutBmut pab1-1]|nr:hypothetical protein CC2G_012757 [Coprinopsis cinerea AmutBmut pab1-1]